VIRRFLDWLLFFMLMQGVSLWDGIVSAVILPLLEAFVDVPCFELCKCSIWYFFDCDDIIQSLPVEYLEKEKCRVWLDFLSMQGNVKISCSFVLFPGNSCTDIGEWVGVLLWCRNKCPVHHFIEHIHCKSSFRHFKTSVERCFISCGTNSWCSFPSQQICPAFFRRGNASLFHYENCCFVSGL
jgi:hypothetical protein